MDAARAEIGSVQARAASPLIEAHQLLALFKTPQERGHRAHVDGKGGQVQKVVQNAADLAIENTDILRAARNLDADGALDGQRPGMLLVHRRDIVQPVEIGQRLKIGLVLDQLLGAAMQQPDMRVRTLDHLAVHLQNKAKNAVRRRVLRAEIHRDGFDLHLSHDLLLTLPCRLFHRRGSAPACLPTGSGSRNRGIPGPAIPAR